MSRIIVFFVILISVFYGSYYYSEDFSDSFGPLQSEWSNEFWYGRDTLVIGKQDNNTQVVSNDELVILKNYSR